MDISNFIYNLALGLPGLLLAIVCHEIAHGRMALKFGDTTAKDAGRLSFNPLLHLDMLGSLIIPLVGALIGGVMFGWAKPVPINPRNFAPKEYRKAIFWVSFAGSLANFILVVLSAFLCAITLVKVPPDFYLYLPLIKIFEQSMYINTILGVFNLIPLPPLDGSRMVSAFLNYNAQRKFDELGRYSFFILLLLIFSRATTYIFAPPIFFARKILEGLASIL